MNLAKNVQKENPLDKLIEEFFNKLKIKHQYYSLQSKQPILLIGEKDLYKAIKETLDSRNFNIPKPNFTIKTANINQFKQLPSFSLKF